MWNFQELKRSYHSLTVHRLRTFLSSLGVLFGVAAVIAMLSIGEGAKKETLEQIEQLGMNNIIIRQHLISEEQRAQALKHHSRGLTQEDVDSLKQNIPSLSNIVSLKELNVSSTGSFTQIAPEILAVSRQYGELKKLQVIEGRFLCDLDENKKSLVCVVGDEIAKHLGKKGHIGHSLRIENAEYQIVGILKPSNWKMNQNQIQGIHNYGKSILIPIGSEKCLNASPDSFTEIILQTKDSQEIEVTAQLIKKILKKLHGGFEDYQLVIPQELLKQACRTQKTFNWILGSIAALSLLVGGIGIMNIMLANVSERTREIGIRRAVGANQKQILFQFLFETLLLTLGGSFLGIVVGISISLAITMLAEWKTIVTLWSVFISITLAIVVGICSGIYPAWQAATKDPITALKQE